jgi:cytochrome d ubiquinol oxidase subunit I
MMMASFLTATFLVAGISAYRILKGDPKKAPRLALKTAIIAAACLAPLQAFIGDLHGLNTFTHQPAKVAAMEGVWETEQGAPMLIFAWPDETERENKFAIGIPKLASLILTHDSNGEIKGLNEFNGEHPPVKPIFFGFRVMVACGILMIGLAWSGSYYLLRKKTLPKRFLQALVACTFLGWLATLAGWYVTEIGRQPYLVTGVLTTADAVTDIPPANVGLTLTAYLTVYALLLWAYIHTVFVMARRSVKVEEFETQPTVNFEPHTTFNKEAHA